MTIVAFRTVWLESFFFVWVLGVFMLAVEDYFRRGP